MYVKVIRIFSTVGILHLQVGNRDSGSYFLFVEFSISG